MKKNFLVYFLFLKEDSEIAKDLFEKNDPSKFLQCIKEKINLL